jgi:hypothetical protein
LAEQIVAQGEQTRRERNAYHREWRRRNPEKTAATKKRYRERYPERVRAAQSDYDFRRRERRMAQYEENKEEYLARNQKWKDRSRSQISAYNRKYWETHRIEHQARRAVAKALKDGTLVKTASCNRCSAPAVIGHHHSYEPEYWLDVEWLCKRCHLRHHAEEKYGDY